MKTVFWIEKAWGEQVDDATPEDICKAIAEMINMDDEHGAFWAGNDTNENMLEVNKDGSIIYILNAQQFDTRLSSWEEAEYLYDLFLKEKYHQIKLFFESRLNNN